MVREAAGAALAVRGAVGGMKSGRLPGYPVTQRGNSHLPGGNSEPTGRKAEAQTGGGLTGFRYTLWRSDAVLAVPDDISQPLLVIIFVLKSK